MFIRTEMLIVCLNAAESLQACESAGEYHRENAEMGDNVTMWCYTTHCSGAEWTLNTTSELIHVYMNRTITGSHNIRVKFSVVNASKGDYSLTIYNVYRTNSGWYDCYEADGKRIIGYYLVVKGLFIIAICIRRKK